MLPVADNGNIVMKEPGRVSFPGGLFARWDASKSQWIKAPLQIAKSGVWPHKPMFLQKDGTWKLVDTTGKPWWSRLE
jgi:hypothetical protein